MGSRGLLCARRRNRKLNSRQSGARSADTMMEFQNVSRNDGTKVAVEEFTLNIPSGEVFALLGHNGAGKTTTIKILVGLLLPKSGQISIGGYDIATRTRDTTSLIGYIPDQSYLHEKLSGREFLTFVTEMYGMAPDHTAYEIVREIERFELHDFIDELTERYSLGMKQRTVFASALLHNPHVLVIDEPLVGLDPHSIRLVKYLLRHEATAGTCIFMSTHTLVVAEEISDRIGIMQHEKLVFDGTISQLRNQLHGEGQALEALYLSLVDKSTGLTSSTLHGLSQR
jgi:ABC-2 type transport system ATP-binding protein